MWVSGTDRDTLSTLAVTSFPTLSFLPRPEWLRRWNTCGKLCPHIKVQRQIERLLYSRHCWLRKNGPLGAGVEKEFQEGWLWATLIHYTTLMRNRWKTGKKDNGRKGLWFHVIPKQIKSDVWISRIIKLPSDSFILNSDSDGMMWVGKWISLIVL